MRVPKAHAYPAPRPRAARSVRARHRERAWLKRGAERNKFKSCFTRC